MASLSTPEGTFRYKERFQDTLHPNHFRQSQDLWFSSIGIGTYLGDPDETTDALYRSAVVQSVRSGCNVIDTAVNYRFQRSERAVGEALKTLFQNGFSREEVILSTKGGFIPFDGGFPADPRVYAEETFFKPGIIRPEEIVAGCHCLSVPYLEHQLRTSLRNLGGGGIDIYFLHNPETQLEEVSREEFNRRMEAAFSFLEKKVEERLIRFYGTATWDGYRNRTQHPAHLDLEELTVMARSVGGENHHFRVIQLPLNLAMPEAVAHANQRFGAQLFSTLEAAAELGITVYASASLLQGRTAQNLPQNLRSAFGSIETDAQRSLQFVRSTPGVVTALVGMKQEKHVEENLALAKIPPLGRDEFFGLFSEERRR